MWPLAVLLCPAASSGASASFYTCSLHSPCPKPSLLWELPGSEGTSSLGSGGRSTVGPKGRLRNPQSFENSGQVLMSTCQPKSPEGDGASRISKDLHSLASATPAPSSSSQQLAGFPGRHVFPSPGSWPGGKCCVTHCTPNKAVLCFVSEPSSTPPLPSAFPSARCVPQLGLRVEAFQPRMCWL